MDPHVCSDRNRSARQGAHSVAATLIQDNFDGHQRRGLLLAPDLGTFRVTGVTRACPRCHSKYASA